MGKKYKNNVTGHNHILIGMRFQECDRRFTRIVEVVGVKGARVQIKTVLNVPNSCQPHTAPGKVGRVTVASRIRFYRNSRGYRRMYDYCHACQLKRGAEEPRGGLGCVTVTSGICAGCLGLNVSLIPSCDFNWPKEGISAIWD